MKKRIKFFVFVFLSIVVTSCQKEEIEIIDDSQNPTPSNLVMGSPIVNLLARTSQFPTGIDNVLDSSSCFSVQLPVSITLNSHNVTLTNPSDYQTVHNIKNVSSTDNDIVFYTYPITINHQDFTSKTINSLNELNNEINNCDEDDDFDEIDCIAINYPISINIYNTDNQIANTITIQHNSQFFNFISNLSNSIIAAINYPISVTDSNSNSIVVNNNTQLENLINDSIDDCNVGSGSSNLVFSSLISSGTWRITYFYDDGDETSDYAGYNFTFNSDGTSVAIKNASTINGSWLTYLDSGKTIFDMTFSDDTLEEIENNWQVVEFSSTIIRFKDSSVGSDDTDYLSLTKN
jgi:hypothetical protein